MCQSLNAIKRPLSVTIAALALGGCASCPAPTPSGPSQSLTLTAYGLAGEIDSLLAEGKLSPAVALRLNGELQRAQADLRAGNSVGAAALITEVKGELP